MTDPMEKPVMIHPADGFFVRNQIDNTAWIDMGGFAIIVDTLEQPHLKTEVLGLIEETIDDIPIKYIINTHTHYDHVALNEALIDKYDSEVISSNTIKIPEAGYRIKGKKRSAVIYHLPGCHTDEDIVVWIPQDRTLFVGDIFGWGIIPLCVNMRNEQVNTLLDTFSKLIALDPDLVIPGHGPLAKKQHLQRWVEYLVWLIGEISARVQADQDDKQILHEIKIPSDMTDWWRLGLWKHEDNVARVLKSVTRFSLEAPKTPKPCE